MTAIQNLPSHEKPREKLLAKGPKHLSDVELLAVMLGSGNRTHSVFSLAEQALAIIDSTPPDYITDQMLAQNGMGQAKACLLSAALEFSRRRIRPEGTRVKEAKDVYNLVSHLSNKPQEHFLCLSLNGAHEVISIRTITIGLANSCQVHPREVLCDAITDRACAIVIAHNHPSGDLSPSKEDNDITQRIKKASEIIGIKLLDHIVFSKAGFYSFQEHGNL